MQDLWIIPNSDGIWLARAIAHRLDQPFKPIAADRAAWFVDTWFPDDEPLAAATS